MRNTPIAGQLKPGSVPHHFLKACCAAPQRTGEISARIDPAVEFVSATLSAAATYLTFWGYVEKHLIPQRRYSLTAKGEAELDRLFALQEQIQARNEEADRVWARVKNLGRAS